MSIVVVGITLGVAFGGSSNLNGNTGATGPTLSPMTLDFAVLQQLIESVSFDEGAALEDTDLPQYKALTWLEGNANLDEYPDWK